MVLGEVPVEAVELVGRHHVQIALGLLDGEEVAAGIQVHAAVGKAGLILNVGARENPIGLNSLVSIDGGGQHLLEGLAGIDKAIEGRCFHAHSLGRDVNHVLLCGEGGILDKGDTASGELALLAGSHLQAGHKTKGSVGGGLVHVFVKVYRGALHVEGALGKVHGSGHGNHVEFLRHGFGTCTQ